MYTRNSDTDITAFDHILAVGTLNYVLLYVDTNVIDNDNPSSACHFEVALMVKLSWERVPKSGALYI